MNKTIVFHFNKKHLEDGSIAPWVFKIDGETYYVHHAEFCNVSFSTKETPLNPHTKASLKVKGNIEFSDDNGIVTAVVTQNA